MPYYTDERRFFDDLQLLDDRGKILCEGDSWFSIPDLANLPIQLDSMMDLAILCLADPGDTLEDLADSGTWQHRKLSRLIKQATHSEAWDAILFSAGGNDVVGPGIRGLLRAPAQPSRDPLDYLDETAVDNAFRRMERRFLRLKALRDNSAKNRDTPILVHSYSYLTPRPVAHRLLVWKVSGPWVEPNMRDFDITGCTLQRRIVRVLLDRFHAMLAGIAALPNANFHVVDTRRALSPVPCTRRDGSDTWWSDEIHPTSRGFAKLARNHFVPVLKGLGL